MDAASRQAIDALRERVIGCGIAVHRHFGPGLLESVYRDALKIETRSAGLRVQVERRIDLAYRGEPVGQGLTLDLLVEDCLVIEVKAVERLHPVHLAQVITYLKLTNCPAGLLMNFNTTSLRSGLRRLERPDLFASRRIGEQAAPKDDPLRPARLSGIP
jgi:GxxExxY protein